VGNTDVLSERGEQHPGPMQPLGGKAEKVGQQKSWTISMSRKGQLAYSTCHSKVMVSSNRGPLRSTSIFAFKLKNLLELTPEA